MATPVVVYSSNDGSIRRIILPDTDAQGQMFLTALAPGEAAILTSGPTDLASCQAAVQAVRGSPCASGRCVVVHAGVVVSLFMGDPLIDTHSQGQLVSSDVASVGDRYDGAAFTRFTVTVDTTTKKVTDASFQPVGAAAAAGKVSFTGPSVASAKAGDAVVFKAPVVGV